jgi:3-dehydroquinate synthase
MSSLSIRTSRGTYEVLVGAGFLAKEISAQTAVIVDPAVRLTTPGRTPVIAFEAHEGVKTLAGVERVLISMHEAGVRRGSSLGAVGGGVIQDVATLASSIYMRGINWTYAPTTMMAMLDSCIGGKSSINVAGIKNLVGNIYPPERVIVDVSVAQSLPIEARIAGYAEAAKICFAGGSASFDQFLALAPTAAQFASDTHMEESILLTKHVLKVKQWFIETDEFDRQERLILNFGHTFAHALESALDFALPHGVAVAIGMAAAIRYNDPRTSASRALDDYVAGMARQLPGDFSGRLAHPDWERFQRALESDKKGSAAYLRFVLAAQDGSLSLQERDRSRTTIEDATAAARQALEDFTRRVGEQT